MADNLTEFLLARIADRERYAKDVHDRDCESLPPPPGMYGPFPCNCGEPARVLAECEAKRRIVALHAMTSIRRAERARGSDDWWWDAYCRECTMDGEYADITKEPREVPCDTLRALASVDADHPDYREEWRP